MTREDGVLDLRDDGLLIAKNVREKGFLGTNLGDEVAPHLVLDRLDTVAACLQFAERSRPIQTHRRNLPEANLARLTTRNSLGIMLGRHYTEVNVTRKNGESRFFGSGSWRDG